MKSMVKIVDVSIVTANFNNGKFLSDFFKSIIASTNYPKEIIFVDDCSTDDSLNLVDEFKVPNIRIIALNKNVGFANALNIGVDQASCKYILRVDPDDYMDIRRIELQFNFLEINAEYDIVGSNSYYYLERLKKVIGKTNLKNSHNEISSLYKNGNHGLGHGTIMCKASILKNNKFIQKNYPAEEYDIFSRIILAGAKCYNMDDCLLYYRIHHDAVSSITKLSTIKKMNELNLEYFGRKNNSISTYSKYLFVKYYRLHLFHYGTLKSYIYLLFAALLNPTSLIHRFIKSHH